MTDAIASLLDSIALSETLFSLVVGIVTVVWSLPRVQEFLKERRFGRFHRLYELAESAVIVTAHSWVDQVKRAQEGGKLGPDDVALARREAMDHLRSLIEREAPALLRHYNEEALERILERAHAALQREGSIE